MTPPSTTAPAYDTQAAADAGESPLVGLAGSVLSGRFRHWRGTSGRRHLFSVFPVGPRGTADDVPRFEDAVVLAVARDAAGRRCILLADETGSLPDLFFASRAFRAVVAAGAVEIHVHLLTDSAAGRRALLRDLDGLVASVGDPSSGEKG